MQESTHHLTVAENFLGSQLDSPDQVRDIFSKLSWSQIHDLTDLYIEYEKAWQPSEISSADRMHLGRAYDTLKYPLAWLHQASTLDRQLDAEAILRLLIYIPKLSIWIPEIKADPFAGSYDESHPPEYIREEDPKWKTSLDICDTICHFTRLRPFLADGSIELIPDRYYVDVCDWRGTEDPSDMLKLAREEAQSAELRTLLEQIDFFADAENQCSDSKFIWALTNAEFIKFVNPLNEINEDIAVQALFGASTLCANKTMYDIVAKKYGREANKTKEMTWSNLSVSLPRLNNLSIHDLMSVRANEEAFNTWRTSLSNAIRETERLLSRPNAASEKELSDIFREVTMPVSLTIEQKIKSKKLATALENGAVTFGAGAIAALGFSADPVTAVMTGAASSSLRVIYDLLKSRKGKVDKSLFRLYSVLRGS